MTRELRNWDLRDMPFLNETTADSFNSAKYGSTAHMGIRRVAYRRVGAAGYRPTSRQVIESEPCPLPGSIEKLLRRYIDIMLLDSSAVEY